MALLPVIMLMFLAMEKGIAQYTEFGNYRTDEFGEPIQGWPQAGAGNVQQTDDPYIFRTGQNGGYATENYDVGQFDDFFTKGPNNGFNTDRYQVNNQPSEQDNFFAESTDDYEYDNLGLGNDPEFTYSPLGNDRKINTGGYQTEDFRGVTGEPDVFATDGAPLGARKQNNVEPVTDWGLPEGHVTDDQWKYVTDDYLQERFKRDYQNQD